MMVEIGQAIATEAGKSGLTGTFVLDGAILIAGLKIVEAVISKVRFRNGRPKPGEGTTCREHGEDIAKLLEFKDNAGDALQRIEGKVDRLLERK